MDSIKITSRIVGGLFIVQMAAAALSHTVILQPILYKANFLTELSTNSTKVTLAMMLDLTCGAAVFGIAVLLFPILKRHSERVALWYMGQRLTELVGFMVSGLFLMTLLKIGQEIDKIGADSVQLETIAIYLRNARGNVQNITLLIYCLGAWSFYGLLFYSRLVPRFISIWGFFGVTLLFVEMVSVIFGDSLGGILIMMPLGLNEIFLGVWLIIKSFNNSALVNDIKK